MACIDLRSDTVSLPTNEMLEAMKDAELGDDIIDGDPTVRKLEELGAEMFGKEAGLFVTSGTMANQVAVMVYTERGQEIILGEKSHMYNLEVAALSCMSQVQPRAVSVDKGYFDPFEVENAIQSPGIQAAVTGLICLENTYDLNRGYAVTQENTREICKLAEKHKIPAFLDGARIFNAALALDKDVKELVEDVDSVQLCLTKGLAAPVGALLFGRKSFIDEARWIRQRIGGGMRQAGVIAAAGVVALEKMVDRLQEDHENTKMLAQGIKEIDSRLLDLSDVQTNIVSIDIAPLGLNGDEFFEQLLERGIKIKKIGPTAFRMVCHHNIDKDKINKVLFELKRLLNK